MRKWWTTIFSASLAVAGLAMAASGCENKKEKVVASAEPKHAAAAPKPPPPAATPPPPSAPPAEPPAADSGHAEGHGKGKADRGAKAGEHDKSEKVIHLARARMEFNHPGNGWTEVKKGGWTLFHPQDKTSVLGFVEFDSAGESTSRIGQIAAHLELTNIAWRGSGDEKFIGPQHLRAHHAEGSCKVATNHHDCELEYYTVEGALLIVYAFETDVKKAEKKERMATRSVETLRRF
jgi:hypothetical protein